MFAANSAAGATTTITIATTDDNLSETAESFTVTLGAISSPLASQVSLKSGASSDSATIAESDAITVSITGPDRVDEGDATANYTVSLSPSGVIPTADLTVEYATADGTAASSTDYTAKSGTLTFTQAAAGAQTFTVSTIEDTIDETDETFTVSITGPAGGGGPTPVLGTDSVTTTITDDDGTPNSITLSVSPDTVAEGDGATPVTVTATLEGGTTRSEATVVTIGTLSGSATKDTDYTVTTALASITIPAGAATSTGTLSITPVNDDVVESDETIVIPGTTTVEGLNVSSASVTLTDGEPGSEDTATLSIAGPAASVDEGTNAEFVVTLSHQVDAAVTVAWSATSTDAADLGLRPRLRVVDVPGEQRGGGDHYNHDSRTDDNLSETAESFTVTLGAISSPLASQVSLKSGASSDSATIAESDAITVSITGPDRVDEGDATANYTVSLSPTGVIPTDDLTVDYATANGTATAGTDYTAKSDTLTFTQAAAGAQTFTVSTIEDAVDEPGETFTVSISSPTGGGGPTVPGQLGTDVGHDHDHRR